MIKRLLVVTALLFALSLPVSAGRVVSGGGYCDKVDCITCVDESCPDTNAVDKGKPDVADSVAPLVMLLALAFFIVVRLRS